MSLIIFWFITLSMWIDVKSLLVVTIDDTSDRIFKVSSSIGLQSCLIEIVLVFRISQWSCIRFQILYILLHFLSAFLLFCCLLFQFFLPNSFPNLSILIILISSFISWMWRFDSLLIINSLFLSVDSFLISLGSINDLRSCCWIGDILIDIKGNVSFLSIVLILLYFTNVLHWIVRSSLLIIVLVGLFWLIPAKNVAHCIGIIAEIIEVLSQGATLFRRWAWEFLLQVSH